MLKELFRVSWVFEDAVRIRPRWSRWHGTHDTEEVIDREKGETLCGRKIPWSIVRAGLHFPLTSAVGIDCGNCGKIIERRKAAGDWQKEARD